MPQTPVESTGVTVEPALLKAVVRVEAPATAHGAPSVATGFIVSCPVRPEDEGVRLHFLVTNKHVVGDWTLADGDILEFRKHLDLSLYGGAGGAFTSVAVQLTDAAGAPLRHRMRLAESPHVDIAVVSLNDLVPATPTPFSFNTLDPSFLLPFDRIGSWFTGVGDRVFALGYPLGITSARTSYPIAKAGYLAAPPGEPFALQVPTTRRNGVRAAVSLDAKMLIVDGLIVPGNSGGPVILPSELKIRRDPQTKQIQFGTSQTQNFVIGVVSMGIADSGLTICFSSDYVLELVQAFHSELTTPEPPGPA